MIPRATMVANGAPCSDTVDMSRATMVADGPVVLAGKSSPKWPEFSHLMSCPKSIGPKHGAGRPRPSSLPWDGVRAEQGRERGVKNM